MTNPTIYIACKDVAGGVAAGKEHLYLLYDPDLDGDSNAKTFIESDELSRATIIRGGPQRGFSGGNVTVQVAPENLSFDSFGDAPIAGQYGCPHAANGARCASSYAVERHYRRVENAVLTNVVIYDNIRV